VRDTFDGLALIHRCQVDKGRISAARRAFSALYKL